MGKIIVVGSLNMDIVNYVDHQPLPGETIRSRKTEFSPGGKGANQAVAAARAGASVTMVGAVGNDSYGRELLASLEGSGVDVSGVRTADCISGLAFITVDQSTGQNTILISGEANEIVTAADLERMEGILDQADAILLQNEISWDVIPYVMEAAARKSVRCFFNPAPAVPLPPEVLAMADIMVVNETEAEIVTGIPVASARDAERAASWLLEAGGNEAVVTMGANGSLHMSRDSSPLYTYTPAYPAEAVDTTAAGDTFIGFLAASLVEGKERADGLRLAAAAAALAVSRKGAQVSIPSRSEAEAFLRENEER